MTQRSNFNHDLNQEQIIGRFLDKAYQPIFPLGSLVRETNRNRQHEGVDLIYSKQDANGKVLQEFLIDEKAQATYFNKDLPTFAFELSYLKDNDNKKGWLFDDRKTTDYYFLITSIYLKNNKKNLQQENDISSCIVTKVKRMNLIQALSQEVITNPSHNEFLKNYEGKTLTNSVCMQLDKDLRQFVGASNKLKIKLNNSMSVFYTGWLKEQPINLVIYLSFLKRTNNSSQRKFEDTPNGIAGRLLK